MTVETTYGKITANRNVLNSLCITFAESAEYNKAKGYNALAKQAEKTFNAIFHALEESGYYKDC